MGRNRKDDTGMGGVGDGGGERANPTRAIVIVMRGKNLHGARHDCNGILCL